MNSLFNTALKQSQAVKRDLDLFSESPLTTPPALLGQISVSLTALARSVDDYDSMARRELVPLKQEKAFSRVKNFRKEIQEFRTQFERLKSERAEAEHTNNRGELLGRRGHSSATPDNPYAYTQPSGAHARNLSTHHHNHPTSGSAFAPSSNYTQNTHNNLHTTEDHLYRERDFATRTNEQLDEFLDRGRSVLQNLGEQKAMLKNTQRKLYSVANTLGISRDTIRMVERRAKQDKWIFYTGVVVFFGFCYLVVKWLR